MAKANAVAAAGFGAVMALMNRFFSQYTYLLLGVTIVYVFVMNRWVTRVVPPPPAPRERKGSFKADKTPPKQRKWDVAKWTLKVMGVGMGVQVVVFALVWMVFSLILSAI